jgi:hypothetical protein
LVGPLRGTGGLFLEIACRLAVCADRIALRNVTALNGERLAMVRGGAAQNLERPQRENSWSLLN